jgi:hypothetical protein
MKTRRPSAAAGTLALVGLCASSFGAACTFPDVTFEDGGLGGDGTTSPDATSESGGGNDGTTGADSIVQVDGAMDAGSDAGVDSVAPVDAGADVLTPPDAGHEAGGGMDAAAETGPRMDSGTDGPNCNCPASQMLPTNLTCPSVLGINCTGSGFTNSPACGTSANYYSCVRGTLQCITQYEGPMVQECQ